MEIQQILVVGLVLWCTQTATLENSCTLNPLQHLDIRLTFKTDSNDAVNYTSQADGKGQVRTTDKLRTTEKTEKLQTTEPSHDVKANSSCDSHCHEDSPRPFYELISDMGYYKFHNRPNTWIGAQQICEKEGAHLGALNSEVELEVLRELQARLPGGTVVYLGLTDAHTEGTWITVTGEPLSETGYVKWGPNEPNGGNKENCVIMDINNGLFVDLTCEGRYPFYCEKKV